MTKAEAALQLAASYGGFDGDWHKAWVIDQMCRALCGGDRQKNEHGFVSYAESEEYRQFVATARAGDDGPETYDWNVGVAP